MIEVLTCRKFLVTRAFLLVLTVGFYVRPTYAQQSETVQKPEWVKSLKPPMRVGQKCFLGSSQGSSDRNKEINDAYKNALINVIEREFPELISIKTESSERLEGSSYSRDTAYKSELVEYKGLTEDKESPYLEAKADSNNFTAYRLLCWSLTGLEAEKARQNRLRSQLSTSVSNTTDSLIPPHAEPGPTGELEIVTVPAAATILLAAEPLGKSNSRFSRVVAGTYDLVIEKEGYEIQSRKVVILAGQKTTEKIELKKLTSTLTVLTQPSNAVVYINNKPVDGRSPLKHSVVVGDDVEIRVELDDYEVESRTMKGSYRSKVENFSLTPKQATLSVSSSPPGADVKLDGKSVGVTPIRGMKIPGGQYDLSIELDGYSPHRETIEVWRSRPANPYANLKPISDSDSIKYETQKSNETDNLAAGDEQSNAARLGPFYRSEKSEEAKNLASGDEYRNDTGLTPFYRFSKRTLAITGASLAGASFWYLFSKPRVNEDATSVERQAQYPPGTEICEYYSRACDKYLTIAGIGAVGSIAALYTSLNMETQLFEKDPTGVASFALGFLSFIVNGWVMAELYENIQAGKASKDKYDEAKTSDDAVKFRSFAKKHSESVDSFFPVGVGLTLFGLYFSF